LSQKFISFSILDPLKETFILELFANTFEFVELLILENIPIEIIYLTFV